MSFNPTDLTYTITGFDSTNNPIVTFGCDGSTQTLASCPTDSADNTKAFMGDYVRAYIAGKQQEIDGTTINAQIAAEDVQALVNQPITPSGA